LCLNILLNLSIVVHIMQLLHILQVDVTCMCGLQVTCYASDIACYF
jgi:hypothetical protein